MYAQVVGLDDRSRGLRNSDLTGSGSVAGRGKALLLDLYCLNFVDGKRIQSSELPYYCWDG